MFAARKTDGAATAAAANYIEDVFSTYLYTGNGSIQSIPNSIALGDGSSDNVSLHLTGDTLTDSSAVPSTLTIEGNTQVNTSIKKYGTGSIYFDGSGDRIVVPSASKLNLDGDFTVEMWVYITNVSTSYQILFDTSASGSAGASMTELWVQSPGNIGYYARGSMIFTGTTTLASNTWYHVALTKQGSTQRLFVNGVVDATATSTTQPNDSYNWYIGDRISGAGSGQYPLQGYIDDFRVTKGVARYTGNFTPPAAALPLDTLITGKGGMVWLKSRSAAGDHALYDTNRGATFDLVSNSTSAQTTQTTGLTSFNGNGFSIGSLLKLNTNAATYASWTFRKQAKFFDVVTYTGTGVARTISHNLGSVPGCIIVKRTSSAGTPWRVYHRSLTSAAYSLSLDQTSAEFLSSSIWNSTAPTSTQFSVGTSGDVNANGATYVAYLFAHDAGGFGPAGTDNVISCGSFTTDVDGVATVNLGYEPQWVMVKSSSDSAIGWQMLDIMRGWVTGTTVASSDDARLDANSSSAEFTGQQRGNVTSTGFVYRTGSASQTCIYIAIRRGPMKTPTSGTSVYEGVAYTGNAATQRQIGSTVLLDALLLSCRSANSTGWSSYGHYVIDRLRGDTWALATSLTTSNSGDWSTYIDFDKNIGWDTSSTTDQNYLNSSSSTFVSHAFSRAPGFFDVVCYTGTGSNTTFTHNLSVVPEMMIVKRRSAANAWAVYANNDNTDYLVLNTDAATVDDNTYWNDTSPTSSVFSVGTNNAVNSAGSTYVAYLFASVTGVSKVGSYTGNGSNQTINCGFTAGARFILIKRISSTGDWYVWDTARGIVSGNDPRLSLNSTAAEVTTDDSIDPDNSGFIVNQLSATNINVNAATYIYLAIA